ncbi:hypothetical protein BBK36DRAFT_8958 [Trichoderma citrinoviride]|uniref:Uncharacterized protein n=1 Tax=Trichoderma citrinoviride TaxID=58853 RepID=A0A2T4AXJ1_9HYPO|nr:hypothetical protein BBK36DRAFT_8958 [Trichoderma citrinoviride]PTB61769.1 hypothetical protein BBK36DRAFT_8958 [Trichoderma citrinoviride]
MSMILMDTFIIMPFALLMGALSVLTKFVYEISAKFHDAFNDVLTSYRGMARRYDLENERGALSVLANSYEISAKFHDAFNDVLTSYRGMARRYDLDNERSKEGEISATPEPMPPFMVEDDSQLLSDFLRGMAERYDLQDGSFREGDSPVTPEAIQSPQSIPRRCHHSLPRTTARCWWDIPRCFSPWTHGVPRVGRKLGWELS